MKIYTKFGDGGQTALFDGTRVPKDDLRIETYGTVDELNSVLGLVLATDGPDTGVDAVRPVLIEIQRQLFDVGADLATPRGSKNEARVTRIGEREIRWLEAQIDAADASLPPLKNFILPGGTPAAARLHVARTVCRRAERWLVRLVSGETEPGSFKELLVYLNRLSDLLFVLARRVNQAAGVADVEWVARKAQETR